jgi:hypothetical protein
MPVGLFFLVQQKTLGVATRGSIFSGATFLMHIVNAGAPQRQQKSSGPSRHAALRVEVTSFKPHVKNTLRGFCDLALPPVGLEINGTTLHEKNGSRWITMPARPDEKDGATVWAAIVEFDSKKVRLTFQTAFLEGIDAEALAEAKGHE